MSISSGLLSAEELSSVFPSDERLKQGAVAIIECVQQIPCDPCAKACPKGAIKPFEDINHVPQIIHEECNGCGICVGKCPGLAIFVVDNNYSSEEAMVLMPYEFALLPQIGQKLSGLDREGQVVCQAKVVKVLNFVQKNQTTLVGVTIPKEFSMVIRNISWEGI